MKITFKSIVKQNDNENVIEFTSELTLSEWDGFKVYEFKEPSRGEMNRIEIKDKFVNIFAGPSTFNLELDKTVVNNYQVAGMDQVIPLVALLNSVTKLDGDDYTFNYSMYNNGNEIGNYEITLNVEKTLS